MVFSDSHCHLDRLQPELLAELLEQTKTKHIDIIISMGMTLESSAETVRLARSYDGVFAAVGIHPWNAVPPTDEIRRQLQHLAKKFAVVFASVGIHPNDCKNTSDTDLDEIEKMAQTDKAIAIGEIGLDYARSPETKAVQRELLIYELSLARETGLPANIHCREAHQDMMEILRREGGTGLKGIIHGFSEDEAQLRDWLDLDFYVSIGRRVLAADEVPSLPAAVRQIPLNRLLT